ncbi:MAG: NRDE family protein [Gammaproteobacteria bacterium]|nr:NRDE family protein [Gammaproteobacteria bacterium]
MCLAAIAWNVHPRYRAIVIANRDEFHARESAALGPWEERGEILAGRDLQAGGTWFALDRQRRFGLITNYRERARPRRSAPTRGRLIVDYLASASGPERFLADLADDTPGYAGFNLLLADEHELWYASNRSDRYARALERGVHGLSNHTLDTPWPKLARLRDTLQDWVTAAADDPAPLWRALDDRRRADPGSLPNTGIGAEWEHILSAPFVMHAEYGTRCSSVLLLGRDGSVDFEERSFDAAGLQSGCARWHAAPGEWPHATH